MKRYVLEILVAIGFMVLLAEVCGQQGTLRENVALNIEPRGEFRVALEKACYLQTVRLSAVYSFSVREQSTTNQQRSVSLRLYQGADVDDHGHDSIERLNAYFKVSPMDSRSDPTRIPMKVDNTNTVTLRIVGSAWLFRDERGKVECVDETKSREWKSKKIIEPEGGANGKQPSGSETNRTSSAASSRRSP